MSLRRKEAGKYMYLFLFDSKGRNLNRLSKRIALFFFSPESLKISDCFFLLFEIYTVLRHENVQSRNVSRREFYSNFVNSL